MPYISVRKFIESEAEKGLREKPFKIDSSQPLSALVDHAEKLLTLGSLTTQKQEELAQVTEMAYKAARSKLSKGKEPDTRLCIQAILLHGRALLVIHKVDPLNIKSLCEKNAKLADALFQQNFTNSYMIPKSHITPAQAIEIEYFKILNGSIHLKRDDSTLKKIRQNPITPFWIQHEITSALGGVQEKDQVSKPKNLENVRKQCEELPLTAPKNTLLTDFIKKYSSPDLEKLDKLLQTCDVNERNEDGWTALHLILSNLRHYTGEHWDVVIRLLKAGADPFIRNHGSTPLDILKIQAWGFHGEVSGNWVKTFENLVEEHSKKKERKAISQTEINDIFARVKELLVETEDAQAPSSTNYEFGFSTSRQNEAFGSEIQEKMREVCRWLKNDETRKISPNFSEKDLLRLNKFCKNEKEILLLLNELGKKKS